MRASLGERLLPFVIRPRPRRQRSASLKA